MPSYPTPSAYQEAIQFPEDAFRDPALQAAYPDENALGLPQPITGNFAAVFPMNAPRGPRWAVKCFLTDVPDQQARYAAIDKHLEAVDGPYMLDFDYQPEGIQVDGMAYPILKMAWAEGVPLNRFVAEHLDAPDTLAQLADAWEGLLDALDSAQVAHGDLQHGNILVQERDGHVHLTLVDYDAMVVPGLDSGTHPEVGHRNYQHPDRTERDVGFYLDRFPGLVIATALRACRVQPALWDRFDTGENLLFRDADFYDPSASVLFDTLADIEPVRPWVEVLRTACYMEPEAVPSLAEVKAGETEQRAWYKARPAATRRRRVRHHVPRTGWARWFLPGTLGVLIATLGLVLTGQYLLAVGWLAGAGGVGGWGSIREYRQLSIIRRRRRLTREEAHFDRLIRNLKRQIESLQAKREDVHTTVDDRRAKRLIEAREEVLYDKLKHHFIGEVAGVEGVTHKHVVRLKKAGIRTAYEAKPERLEHLRTIGDQTTARITMWRSALVAEYEDALPEALSPAEERRIQRYIERRIDSIDAEVARAREKIRVQQAERAQIQARKAEIPPLPASRYLSYLLRLDTLPEPVPRPGARDEEKLDDRSRENHASVTPLEGTDNQPWWVRQE
jgi:hypothetical protein